MKFTELSLDEKILKGIEDMGYTECTPVQEETFKLLLENKDVFAQSQTGTGKTVAFLVTAYQLMLHHPDFQGRKALIVAPTRELADQIEKEAKLVARHLNFKVGCFYGGVGYNQQEKLLEDGVDIIIGTPGRLLDFSQSKKLDFKDVGIFVIDEADRMFDMGFLPDLQQIMKTLPPRELRRTLLFSATLNAKVGNLAWEYMVDPGEIEIQPEQVTVDKITQELYHVSTHEKMPLLLGLLKREQPERVLIFANTKHTVIKVAKRLQFNGYKADYIIGDLPQNKRNQLIEDVKSGALRYLVATDVAARGLHIDDLTLVINYDLPNEAENYVHRVGRTARAGKSGKALSLACEKFVFGLKAIEEYTGIKIPVTWFDESSLVQDKSAGLRISGDLPEPHPSRGRRDGPGGGGRSDGRRPEVARRPDGRRPATGPVRDNAGRRVTQTGASIVSEATGGRAARIMKSGGSPETRSESRQENRPESRSPRNKPRPPRVPVSASAKPQTAKAAPSGGQPVKKVHTPQEKHHHAPVKHKGDRPAASRTNMTDRLAYYRSKYGENFKASGTEETSSKKKTEKKPGILSKIVGFFFGKKSEES